MRRLPTALLVVFLVLGCRLTEPQTHMVTYRIDGFTDSADVTYVNSHGGTQQENDVNVPWTQQYQMKDGDFLYISAQGNYNARTVAVFIDVDGKSFKQAVSSGPHTVATVSARCCYIDK